MAEYYTTNMKYPLLEELFICPILVVLPPPHLQISLFAKFILVNTRVSASCR